jgi:protein involved in polysaccharide export with SLBB domain
MPHALTRRSVEISNGLLTKSARLMALFIFISVLPWFNAAVRGAELISAITESNAVATGSNSKALTSATTRTTQPATNRLEATPSVGTGAVATNLSQAGTTNAAVVLDDKHKLAIGDRLSLRILEDEEDPKPLFVTDSGDLEVPYIGRFPAENKTCRQLAAEIKTALEKEYYYQATVIIAVDLMTKSHGRVYLVGAVKLAGPVELPSDEALTLSRSVLRAGGFTDYADRHHVKVTRKNALGKDDKKTFIVDVGEIFDKGRIESDLILESGDLIFVPDRLIRF